MSEPEKLDLRSHDIAEEKRQELLRLFPEIRTKGGKIDFERLKLALGEMAASKPERVVCLGEGFAGNDQLKANEAQIFKAKRVTSFKTV